jgi:hypothetical protein
MTNFKSNLPKDFKLDTYYQPVKSKQEKKEASERSKKNWQDPNYIEKNLARQLEGAQDSKYRKSKSAQMKKIAATPEWREKYEAGRAKIDLDSLGANVSKALKLSLSTPEARAKKKEVAKKNYENPDYVKKRREGLTKALGKPVMTPDGQFASIAEAGIHYNKIRNFNNGPKWVRGMIDKKVEGFYYI